MARPLNRRGAKSRANLKRTAGPGRKKITEQDREIRRITKRLLLDRRYMANLRARAISGKLQPGVEAMLWYYAFGKPPDVIEAKQVVPVRIQNIFAPEVKE
jgi:hypothetical protein